MRLLLDDIRSLVAGITAVAVPIALRRQRAVSASLLEAAVEDESDKDEDADNGAHNNTDLGVC